MSSLTRKMPKPTEEQLMLEKDLEVLDAEIQEVSGFLQQIKRERVDVLVKLQRMKTTVAPIQVGS